MEFFRQEYWSGLPFPSLGDHPNLGIEPRSPALEADSSASEPPAGERLKFAPGGQELGSPRHPQHLVLWASGSCSPNLATMSHPGPAPLLSGFCTPRMLNSSAPLGPAPPNQRPPPRQGPYLSLPAVPGPPAPTVSCYRSLTKTPAYLDSSFSQSLAQTISLCNPLAAETGPQSLVPQKA